MIGLALGIFATACLVVFMVTEGYECWRCHSRWGVVARRRQNTCYNDHESNFAVLCRPCQADADDYWAERWAEYRSMVL